MDIPKALQIRLWLKLDMHRPKKDHLRAWVVVHNKLTNKAGLPKAVGLMDSYLLRCNNKWQGSKLPMASMEKMLP